LFFIQVFLNFYFIKKMPYKMRKLPNIPFYRVYNSETGAVRAYRTTLEKAKAMLRLLRAVEHGWRPTGSPRRGGSPGKPGRAYR
jgi:hypothetical protein